MKCEEDSDRIKTEEREEASAMEVEDGVVAEYDVYFTKPPPQEDQTRLYVLQYPIRPAWRPYELDQRCTEVRVKPNSAEMEVDLSIDMDSANYDPGASIANKMKKQTLSSSGSPPATSCYAVGVLKGKKLYLNPINAVVQLRPSMDYLNFGGSKKRNIPEVIVKAEGSSVDPLVGPSGKQNKQLNPEVDEKWIPLKYHSITSDLSAKYLQRTMKEESNSLQFSMNSYDYLNSFCPGASNRKMQSKVSSRRFLLSLPLEERLKTSLAEGPSVRRFSALKHLAPEEPVEDVLRILQKYAFLIQGLWVPKTAIQCSDAPGAQQLLRDYALVLFNQNPVIPYSQLDALGSRKSAMKDVLNELAIDRSSCKDWKFKEPTDVSFMKLYPDIVKEQEKLLRDLEKRVSEHLFRDKTGPTTRGSSRPCKPSTSNQSARVLENTTNGARAGKTSMSDETRDALPKFLIKLFHAQKVCSFQTICQGLRDMAVSMSALPKADATARAALAAAKAVDAPQEELQAVINEVAVNVHGVYILKSSVEHPEFNELRNVVIELFLANRPDKKLKMSEVITAAKIKGQKEPSNSEFRKVITEFCVSKGGAWVLKSVDGVLK